MAAPIYISLPTKNEGMKVEDPLNDEQKNYFK